MSKSVLIKQAQGLGDILFCQKIAAKLIENGYEVYWPVASCYSWVSHYLVRDNLFFHYAETDYVLNIQHSIEENHPVDIMSCKYDMIGKTLPDLEENLHSIPYEDWNRYTPLHRDITKEEFLYKEILGLKEDSEYIFINKNYGSGYRMEEVGKHVKNHGLAVICQTFFTGFTAFDWCKVIENASEIHTADTSINYIIDLLDCKATEIVVHPRHKEHTHKALSRLFSTKFKWSGYDV